MMESACSLTTDDMSVSAEPSPTGGTRLLVHTAQVAARCTAAQQWSHASLISHSPYHTIPLIADRPRTEHGTDKADRPVVRVALQAFWSDTAQGKKAPTPDAVAYCRATSHRIVASPCTASAHARTSATAACVRCVKANIFARFYAGDKSDYCWCAHRHPNRRWCALCAARSNPDCSVT